MARAPGGEDRRRFSRMPFNRPATLQRGEESHEARLVDICLYGARLELQDDHQPSLDDTYRLSVELAPGAAVEMHLRPVHVQDRHVGFRGEYVGLDSLHHLRRMLELHLRDESALYRQLEELEKLGIEVNG